VGVTGSDGAVFTVQLPACRWVVTASDDGRLSVRMAARYGAGRLADDLEYLAAAIRRGDVTFTDDPGAAHMRVSPIRPPAAPTRPGTGAAGIPSTAVPA
jgi:hypothetical protein